MEITQHSRYVCTFCGKNSVKRTVVGIWKCGGCNKTMAGGAWTVSTTVSFLSDAVPSALETRELTKFRLLLPFDRPSDVSEKLLRSKAFGSFLVQFTPFKTNHHGRRQFFGASTDQFA